MRAALKAPTARPTRPRNRRRAGAWSSSEDSPRRARRHESAMADAVAANVTAVARCMAHLHAGSLQTNRTRLATASRWTVQAPMGPTNTAYQTVTALVTGPACSIPSAVLMSCSPPVGREEERREHQQPDGVHEVPVEAVHLDRHVVVGGHLAQPG